MKTSLNIEFLRTAAAPLEIKLLDAWRQRQHKAETKTPKCTVGYK